MPPPISVLAARAVHEAAFPIMVDVTRRTLGDMQPSVICQQRIWRGRSGRMGQDSQDNGDFEATRELCEVDGLSNVWSPQLIEECESVMRTAKSHLKWLTRCQAHRI